VRPKTTAPSCAFKVSPVHAVAAFASSEQMATAAIDVLVVCFLTFGDLPGFK
jgi:hypothetical protein